MQGSHEGGKGAFEARVCVGEEGRGKREDGKMEGKGRKGKERKEKKERKEESEKGVE